MRTKNDKKKFLEALTKTPLVSYAAKQVAIDKATIYRWMKKNKEFKKKVEEAQSIGRESFCDLAESKLFKKVSDGDFKSIKLLLENNSKRYIRPRPNNIFIGSRESGGLTKQQMEKLDNIMRGEDFISSN